MVLTPVNDWAAQMARPVLETQGSTNIQFFEHDGHRIVTSVDPSGNGGGLERHVSVSCHQRPVAWEVAERYAAELFPGVAAWDREDNSGKATHLYASLAR